MKIGFIILFNFLLFFSGVERKKPVDSFQKIHQVSMEAKYVQDVQSFYSINPDSRIRNKAEFWEDRVFYPIMK